jgi:hypothetical protein
VFSLRRSVFRDGKRADILDDDEYADLEEDVDGARDGARDAPGWGLGYGREVDEHGGVFEREIETEEEGSPGSWGMGMSMREREELESEVEDFLGTEYGHHY